MGPPLNDMRVLLVTGRFHYGDRTRGPGYEFVNFSSALRRLGHEVAVFDNLDRSQYADFGQLNLALLDHAEAWKPDVMLSVLMHYEIWLQTLALIRDIPVRLVNWATDDSWRFSSFSRFVAPVVDVIATTYPSALERYQRLHLGNPFLTQWAADAASLSEPLPGRDCEFQVSFVGTAYGHRRQVVERLRRHGLEVTCFGQGWENGPISSKDLLRIYRTSVISLNLSRPALSLAGAPTPRHRRQIKARVFEVPGAGGFLLTEEAEGLDHFYRIGEEIEVFHGFQALVTKCRHYLRNLPDRDAVARAGFERTRMEHTYDRRFAALLSFTLGAPQKAPATASPNQRRQILEGLAAQHSLSPREVSIARMLERFGRTTAGERALRAMRRLTLAVSWRLQGARAYGATGTPGRFFYRVS